MQLLYSLGYDNDLVIIGWKKKKNIASWLIVQGYVHCILFGGSIIYFGVKKSITMVLFWRNIQDSPDAVEI